MAIKKIVENVINVGVEHWDREIFDSLIPLPDGTTYNSYVIKGSEKIALIDTVDETKGHLLKENLKNLGIERLDYIIANHAEQDHSGYIPAILNMFPGAKVVTNTKCKGMLIDLLHVKDEDFIVIEDGEEISLGDKTLKFILTPWVHWPETMSTYLKEDKILFSCDFFGSHYATSDTFVVDEAKTLMDAKRYYAEIMMPFRKMVARNVEKVNQYELNMIAPSHGPVYKNPKLIINAYKEWVSDDVKNVVLLLYISMHGSTEKIAEHLIDSLIAKGIEVKPFNVLTADIGQIAIAMVDACTIILASPMVLAGAHPGMISVAHLANALRPKVKNAAIVGSYGWGGNMVEQIKSVIPNLKVDLFEPVLIKGLPRDDDYKKLDKLIDEVAAKHVIDCNL
ncbi:FprA family A-type flavoprotein [candidate division TA06 bacterium]|uniref:FprA family A-type flavoprotein n=1 Tax=candidate division TA06 bacterium TaxID=2250710 RepID=A0A660SBM8_UNCT6|nr:MAG: FprA family A-type flavoprotein [candidate division TA06 bacterium]